MLFTKIAVNILFQIVYIASFVDSKVFPFLKRTTAIGICNFFARLVTIFAPIAAELDKPMPELLLIVVVLLAFFISLTLPLEDYDDDSTLTLADNKETVTGSVLGDQESSNKPKNE